MDGTIKECDKVHRSDMRLWSLTVTIKNIQTAHLVHDLKNPVNIIETGARSLLENSERYGELTPRQEKVVRRMLRNALKLRQLANSMLEVDMASKGILKPTLSTLETILRSALVEVCDIVDPGVSDALEDSSSLDEFRNILEQNHIYLDVEDIELKETILVDETKLCLILTNLLSNAFKYRQKNVYLKCKADREYLTLSVRDDGPGIPPCYHQQIFDQYFQYCKADEFPVRGHGLGLAGAQALAEALGGSLTIEKTEEGAEFMVRVRYSTSK